MRDQPTGDDLLETARAVLRDELIPTLPPDKRHAALMIANAMGVATRQLRNGRAPERVELADLCRLLGDAETGAPPRDADLSSKLSEVNRTLCQRIRQGAADAGQPRIQFWSHLRAVTRARVAESNPKYLEAEGG